MTIYLVYRQIDVFDHSIVKAFKNEEDAKKFVKDLNDINNPEHDDWGYVDGTNHEYFSMELE
jgi:hypothetical protein